MMFYLKGTTFKIKDSDKIINGILYKDCLFVKYRKKESYLSKYKEKTIIYNDDNEYEIETIDENHSYLLSYKNKYYDMKCMKIKLIKRR